jgi:hypothetical protein
MVHPARGHAVLGGCRPAALRELHDHCQGLPVPRVRRPICTSPNPKFWYGALFEWGARCPPRAVFFISNGVYALLS